MATARRLDSFNAYLGTEMNVILTRMRAGMAKIKSHADRGLYYPLQAAAVAALNGPKEWCPVDCN